MKTEWTKGLAEADKQERRELVRSARPTLEVLKGILQERLEAAQASASRSTDYAPGWEHKQRDALVQARVYRDLIELLTLDRE